MADYRRCYILGGSFFFTVVTERRAPILGNDLARDLLRAAAQCSPVDAGNHRFRQSRFYDVGPRLTLQAGKQCRGI